MIWLLIGCADQPPISSEHTEVQTITQYEYETKDGMVHVPTGMVSLGPRTVPQVPGYQPPINPMGITPNNGDGDHQRAPGAPPPPMGKNGHPVHGGQQKGKGVGHVRPGSGMPSAPPNMPGSQAKDVGPEERWTANPGHHMKAKKVRVSDFWIDITEVTRKEYKIFLEKTGYRPPYIAEEWAMDGWNWNGSNFPEGTADHPVIMVNWYDAVEYCRWMDKRLPTEAQWQLAALGDLSEGRHYPWGKEYNHSTHNHGKITAPNFDDSDGYLTTSPVGSFPTGNSPYGLQDIFGNAWEFTADARRSTWKFYEESSVQPPLDTTALPPSLYVAVRGGAYFFDLRPHPAGERNEFLTEIRRKTSGFRCVK